MKEDCLKEIICVNYRQDHPAHGRSYVVYKKRKINNLGETQEDCVLPERKENCRQLYGESRYALLHGGRIEPMKTNIENSENLT